MAFGTRCIHCGWQESSHYINGETEGEDEKPSIARKNYQHSLETCEGFYPDDPRVEFLTAISEIRRNVTANATPESPEELVSDVTRYAGLEGHLASIAGKRIGATYHAFKHLLH